MPSWSLCLSPVSGAVSGQVSDASVELCLVQTGSEDVLKNQFYLGFSWPVTVPSGPVTGWVSYPCYAATMLMRLCGSAPVSLCGFCPADAACRSLPMSLYLLIFLWFRNLWGLILANVSMVRMCSCVLIMKYLMRVATVGSCSVWQHICVSSFASSRSCGAIAATFVVSFVELAAFAFVHSATACGHSDPAGGSCFQCVAATLAALLVASFVFVPLCAVLLEFAGILNLTGCDASEMLYLLEGMCVFAGVYWCVDGDFAIFCRCGSCMWSAASSSSLCAYVGCFFFLEGILFWLDGIFAFAFVALFLVGVYFVCCRGSSCKDDVPSSSIIALVGDFFFF